MKPCIVVCFFLMLAAGAQAGNVTVAGYAGPDESPGSVDGTGSGARFNGENGVCADTNGNVYVADTLNHTIRKISPGGVVTTLAGLSGSKGCTDGAGGQARFSSPAALCVDTNGNVYVADTGNDTIRKITPDGMVTTFAGAAGNAGSLDGTGADALFNLPYGICVDRSGNLYVADAGNNTIRKITSGGVVTTLAGTPNSAPGSADGTGGDAGFGLSQTSAGGVTCYCGICVDAGGTVYVGDAGNVKVRKITPAGVVTTLAGGVPNMYAPQGVAVDGSGNVYLADAKIDSQYSAILKVTPAGVVTKLAGGVMFGIIGHSDGPGAAATFNNPCGLCLDGSGNLYVADVNNALIRKVTTAGAVVTTVAGLPAGFGTTDGASAYAMFNNPMGLCMDASGNLYVADTGSLQGTGNCTIRKITPAGVASTLAGSPGVAGTADGTGSAARFKNPSGVCVDGSGNLYVADNCAVRRITPAGVVTTIAGVAGTAGTADGTGSAARFNAPAGVPPLGICMNTNGDMYVTEEYRIRKVTPAGVVTTLAGSGKGNADGTGPGATFNQPNGLCFGGDGNLYVVDFGNGNVRKVTLAGVVTTLAGPVGTTGTVGYHDGTGSAVRFKHCGGICLNANGNLYAGDGANSVIREVTLAGVVTTAAGVPRVAGSKDGIGSKAKFGYVFGATLGMCMDSAGKIYCCDSGNSTIRKIVPAIPDVATIDQASGMCGTPRQLGASGSAATNWQWRLIRRPTGSTAQLSSATMRNPVFTPDVTDLYLFELYASGPGGMSISTVNLQGTPAPPTYAITTIGGAHGTFTPNGTIWVSSGAMQSFAVTAEPYCHVSSIILGPVMADVALQVVFDANLAACGAPEAWLAASGLTNGIPLVNGHTDFDAAALADTDHDGMPNWAEYQAGTDPQDANSALRIISATPSGNAVTLKWSSVPGHAYDILAGTNVANAGSFLAVSNNLPASATLTNIVIVPLAGTGTGFYRVRLH